MFKWILLGLGALIVLQYLNRKSSGSSLIGTPRPAGNTFTGIVDSLSGLTNAVGRLIGSKNETAPKDPDGLVTPSWL